VFDEKSRNNNLNQLEASLSATLTNACDNQ
jgi:hypothetical protein